ncbi:hypothetical protein [Bordetella trematum]|uniref:hypothetical protein n=1 Tax=Bordetella trematum TaxID=123899 RepID=UPI0013FD4530|nr:hypothetical protein [Bordetella trematum]
MAPYCIFPGKRRPFTETHSCATKKSAGLQIAAGPISFFYKNNPARPGFIFSSHPHSRLLRTKIDIYYVFGILMRQPAGRAESLCNNYINDGIFFLRADKGNTHSKQRDKIRTMATPGFFVLSGRLIS